MNTRLTLREIRALIYCAGFVQAGDSDRDDNEVGFSDDDLDNAAQKLKVRRDREEA